MSKGKTSPSSTGQEKINLETAFKIMEGIQEQIRFADAKAGFLIALLTAIFGFTMSMGNLDGLKAFYKNHHDVCIALGGLYFITTFAAVMLSLWVVRSRFGGKAPQTRVFFAHIASKYGRDHARYVNEIKTITTDGLIGEVGTQILEVSHIATDKHSTFRRASNVAFISLVIWGMFFVGILRSSTFF